MSKAIKVLVIEDSEDDTKIALWALRHGGFDPTYRRVQDAAGLQEALRQERWDAVISDFRMPNFSGTDALRILQSTGLDIPFILISGAVGEEVAVEAMKSGASDYVMKTNLTRLAPALERQLADAATRVAHRRTQRELVESEERFRRLTALSSDWYWELDEELLFTRISEGFAGKLAHDAAQFMGRAHWELPDVEADWTTLRAALQGREPFRDFEVRQMRADGTIVYLSLSGEPMVDPTERFCGYHGVGTDITERTRNERLKSEFVATVSHELRTPLTSIAGSLSLLHSGALGTVPAPVKRLLKIALDNSQRLARLINDMLDIEKLEAGKVSFNLRRTDVKALAEQAIEANAAFADTFNVKVRLDDNAADAAVNADPDRLMQVLINLLSNAVKFSPAGQEILITILSGNDRVRIGVRDHGSGIPEEFKSRIFEKFAQVDSTDARRRGGSGLGLNIVQQIVMRFGGTIGYEAAPGGGTIFTFDLPCWDASTMKEVSGEDRAPEAPEARPVRNSEAAG